MVEEYEAISKTITTCFLGLTEEKMAIPHDNDIAKLVLGGEICIKYSLKERESAYFMVPYCSDWTDNI
jgi:hypothetical protein